MILDRVALIVGCMAVAAGLTLAWPALADGGAGARTRTRYPAAEQIAGPIIGGLAANNGYYAYGPYAGPGSPVAWRALPWSDLYGPAVPVTPGCYMQRQRVWTDYGWRWRTGPICY